MKTLHIKTLIITFLISLSSCNETFLDARPDKSLLVPATAADFRAILDNITVMNSAPGLPLIASDDFYTTQAGLNSLILGEERNAYIWADKLYESQVVQDWNRPFQQILNANIVLGGLAAPTTKAMDKTEADNLRGSALFYRAMAYLNLVQLFSDVYIPDNALSKPGMPLHLSADVNERPGRGSLQQTYDRIIQDLLDAKDLLPTVVPFKTRPSRQAALALLARTYLQMQNYQEALEYAQQALTITSFLNDYNTLSTTAARPFPVAVPYANEEVIYYASLVNYSYFSAALTKVDPSLYASYASDDLRKVIFYNSTSNFKGTYTGRTDFFGGIAVDELFLIKSESLARLNKVPEAMEALNSLLIKRWKTGTFSPLTAGNPSQALTLILSERRKELAGRGLRWMDLRRLNIDAATSLTLTRILDGKEYKLSPGDKRYIFPIPDAEISAGGIAQNE